MIETIYNDFVTKMLPSIQEGLVITKDYFTDLFGRYVTYLIWSDAITLVLLTGALIACWVVCAKVFKYLQADPYTEWVLVALMAIIPGFFISGLIGMWYITGQQLIKDIYIPEVRVYEEFQNYKESKHK